MDPETHALLALPLAPDPLKQTVLATTPHKAPGLDGLPYDVLRQCSDLYYENLSDALWRRASEAASRISELRRLLCAESRTVSHRVPPISPPPSRPLAALGILLSLSTAAAQTTSTTHVTLGITTFATSSLNSTPSRNLNIPERSLA